MSNTDIEKKPWSQLTQEERWKALLNAIRIAFKDDYFRKVEGYYIFIFYKDTTRRLARGNVDYNTIMATVIHDMLT